jgi:hypothetical protein
MFLKCGIQKRQQQPLMRVLVQNNLHTHNAENKIYLLNNFIMLMRLLCKLTILSRQKYDYSFKVNPALILGVSLRNTMYIANSIVDRYFLTYFTEIAESFKTKPARYTRIWIIDPPVNHNQC